MLMSAEPEGLPAGSISTALGVAPNKLSAHLNILLRAGLIDLDEVERGDRLVIRLTLNPEQRRTNPMIVEDMLPAGLEIEGVLSYADGSGEDGAFSWLGEIQTAKTAEARDDRFVAAIDVREDSQILAYVVRAVTAGEFVFPGAVAEDMYRPDVYARSPAERLTIAGNDG